MCWIRTFSECVPTSEMRTANREQLVDCQRRALIELGFVFLVSCLILFLGMSLRPNAYDEGLVLTAAMRVGAGQIPHRDFYANYGPAQFYILAGLFKVFGQSILVERLYDLFIEGLLVVAVFVIARSFCGRAVAVGTATVTVLWLFCLIYLTGIPVIPVSLLNVVSSALILPVFVRSVSTTRMLAAGALAGVAALFRYDTGVALFGTQTCVIIIALYFGPESKRLRTFGHTWGPYVLGFAMATLPPALYYLTVAPLHPIVHDIVLYPGRYYHRGRNLPFPRIALHTFENVQVYLPIPVVAISLYAAATRAKSATAVERKFGGFLVTFGLLALVMYFKGFVRMEVTHMYLCMIPSLLLVAVLFQYRMRLARPAQIFVVALLCLSLLAVASSTRHRRGKLYHPVVLENMSLFRGPTSPEIQLWCALSNPFTRGICFLPGDDRMRTIEFVDSHTTPGQRLYVGLVNHDKIFENDNLIYFGSQRLPATHWSHFDPGLQNSYGIQSEMIKELEINHPPYVVLDSEFAQQNEPNDSARSTGVTMLDEYIREKYQRQETFGVMSIWQRINPVQAQSSMTVPSC